MGEQRDHGATSLQESSGRSNIGNIFPMELRRQILSLGLEADRDAEQAERVLLFRLLLANGMELRTRMDRQLSDSGLTTQQAMVLQVLQGQAEAPTLKQLASTLAMSHQNLKQIANVLERKGFLEITTDEQDGRVRRLHLTKQHHRFWKRRNTDDHAEVGQWTAALSLAEVRALVRGLDKLHRALMQSRGER
ncbi:MarR family transcriptional regulator [Variovorax sp. LjRoot130]|uniref:MarR family winged helix-turn-helix transcriptional regulator n=1 Tax=Variovorax sp. LjRoot130 TaxID=3342261 RepID=UPI003ECE8055